ncbi:MAG: SDR family oxidoreductase, partial [Hyphomicrobiales bacterium]|nr:SDR family oxidoreductase [Hyphomicrobiales bacterium]
RDACICNGNDSGKMCKISYKTCNVALEEDVAARFGGADILINNAGINPNYTRAEKTTLKEWQDVVAVNLTGVFLSCRIFGQRMLEKGAGSIVNVNSVAGHVGLPRTAAYCAAKGGVEIMSKSLAIEWAARGVRVNCIAPGYFETDLTAGLRDNASLSENMLSHPPGAVRPPAGTHRRRGVSGVTCLCLCHRADDSDRWQLDCPMRTEMTVRMT